VTLSAPVEVVEYEPAQHVDSAVVADIAGWLDGRVRAGV
jgi:hypothetical protein